MLIYKGKCNSYHLLCCCCKECITDFIYLIHKMKCNRSYFWDYDYWFCSVFKFKYMYCDKSQYFFLNYKGNALFTDFILFTRWSAIWFNFDIMIDSKSYFFASFVIDDDILFKIYFYDFLYYIFERLLFSTVIICFNFK